VPIGLNGDAKKVFWFGILVKSPKITVWAECPPESTVEKFVKLIHLPVTAVPVTWTGVPVVLHAK
jgi:hypothetical protein